MGCVSTALEGLTHQIFSCGFTEPLLFFFNGSPNPVFRKMFSWLLSGRCGSLVGFLRGTQITGLVFDTIGTSSIFSLKHIPSGGSINILLNVATSCYQSHYCDSPPSAMLNAHFKDGCWFLPISVPPAPPPPCLAQSLMNGGEQCMIVTRGRAHARLQGRQRKDAAASPHAALLPLLLFPFPITSVMSHLPALIHYFGR